MTQQRKVQVSLFDNFIKEFQNKLGNVIEFLSWTEEDLKSSPKKVQCPACPDHSVVEPNVEAHSEICQKKQQGENPETDLPSSHFFYTKSTSVVPVLIDSDTQYQILSNIPSEPPVRKVPGPNYHIATELSQQQRVAIYDYVVDKAQQIHRHPALSLEDLNLPSSKKQDEKESNLSRLEMMAAQRDLKRRRQSYRAKNVHLTNKSYTEILREIIQNQLVPAPSSRSQGSSSSSKRRSRSYSPPGHSKRQKKD